MFLIRCAFWLTVVFTSLPWPQTQSQTMLADAMTGLIRSATGHADVSARRCLVAPQVCADQARKVQALLEAASVAKISTDAKRVRPAS